MQEAEAIEREVLAKRRKLADGRCLLIGNSVEMLILSELLQQGDDSPSKTQQLEFGKSAPSQEELCQEEEMEAILEPSPTSSQEDNGRPVEDHHEVGIESPVHQAKAMEEINCGNHFD